VERAKQGRIDEDDFRASQRMVVALYAQQYTTVGAQAARAALDELYGLGFDYHETFDARIEAVRLDAVVEAARKYFKDYVLVTSSPEKSP